MSTDEPAGAEPSREDTRADSAFAVEDVTPGPAAHGFGTAGGREFAFQVHRGTLRLEIYSPVRPGPVPGPEDVVAAAELPVADVDLDDARSITALVRDAVAEAERAEQGPGRRPAVVRTLLSKLGSVIDGI